MRHLITRRTALQSLAGAAALTLARSRVTAQTPKSSPAMPASSGSLNQSVCKWCYKDIPLEDLAAKAKEIGLGSIELLNPEDFPTLRKYDLYCAMVNAP